MPVTRLAKLGDPAVFSDHFPGLGDHAGDAAHAVRAVGVTSHGEPRRVGR